MKAVKARKDSISGDARAGVEKRLRETSDVTVRTGHARFESARSVRVDGDLLTADRIFVNVGGRAVVPSDRGSRRRCLTSTTPP